MDQNCYRIEVLHYLNPHLMWVEVHSSKKTIVEQIGIFAVLPQSVEIDLNGEVVLEKSNTWLPAVNNAIQEFLSEPGKFYFMPIHIDRRSSIFNDNIHKFGDICLKNENGQEKYLSQHLETQSYAYKDECEFYLKLSSGNIITKLNQVKTEEVLSAIKKHFITQEKVTNWKEDIDKQTSLYREEQNLRTVLTTKNLQKHNRIAGVKIDSVIEIIDNKARDLNLCKDIDEQSIGRGSRRKKLDPAELKHKLTLVAEEKNSPKSILMETKKCLETHVHKKYLESGKSEQSEDSEITGHGIRTRKLDSTQLNKKLELVTDGEHSPFNMLIATKKYLDANGQRKSQDSERSDRSEYSECEKYEKLVTPEKPKSQSDHGEIKPEKSKILDWIRGKSETPEKCVAKARNDTDNASDLQKHHWTESSPVRHEDEILDKHQEYQKPRKTEDESWETTQHDDKTTDTHQVRHRRSVSHQHHKKATSPQAAKTQSKNDNTKYRLLAYGPPMSAQNTLKIIQVPDVLDVGDVDKRVDKVEDVEEVRYDDYKGDDSEVDITISNLDALKKLRSDNQCTQSDQKFISKPETNLEQVELRPQIDKTPNQIEIRPQDINIEDRHEKSFSQKQVQDTKEIETKNTPATQKRLMNLLIKRKLKVQRDTEIIMNNNSSNSDTSAKDISDKEISSSSDKEISTDDVQTKIRGKLEIETLKPKVEAKFPVTQIHKVERNVNPFKNVDGSKSVFVDKLVSPILMVHTKNDNLILPQCSLRDIPFKTDTHIMLKNMLIKEPNRLQSVSWPYILRGHSCFMISPAGSGKTLGYVPAVCNLVMDSIKDIPGVGPICIIVCATSQSVTSVNEHCKRFFGLEERVLACFPGITTIELTTALLNGCDLLVCTPSMLCRLLGADFGVDLRRLTTLVFDDCERLSQVYASEVKLIQNYVKEMLRNRADKNLKVQYVVASRQWCDFLTPLAKSAPDSIVAIGAFQECVLYSKTNTTVNYVMKDNKVNTVVDFLKEINTSKRTVIVCRTDDEVELLQTTLMKLKYVVFACNNMMTLQDLYNLNVAWGNYQEPVLGPILICCDGNLTHLNVTDASYLVHFSMPAMFSMFCKRFAVLNDNYVSIFGPKNENVKIKILLEENNVEQLPKILHFVKRCTNEVPAALDAVSQQVLEQKDLVKAEKLVPICDTLLTLGECADPWNCQERHAILKDFDEPKDWMPKNGVVQFKILHYDTAVTYSARLLANVTKSKTTKFSNNYSTLSLKMGMYYSKDANKKLHGTPKIGDFCAVAVKQNFFARCQVVKILSYSKGIPHKVLINLIDEEELDISRDVYLYHLPEEFRMVETHVVKVRLANIQPQDKDVTFSVLAKDQLKKMTDKDENLYFRGKIVMTVSNCIFVDTLEACQDLSSLGETVVKHNFKTELLEVHAIPNQQHIEKLQKISEVVNVVNLSGDSEAEVKSPVIQKVEPNWAYLQKDDFSAVIFASIVDAGTFFVRLDKFEKVINLLIQDIKEHVEKNLEPLEDISVGNIVLAEFTDDKTYERARIDAIIEDNKVKCFFVDIGDWREVATDKLRLCPDKFLQRIPFQAIECRLIGTQPPGDEWTEFSTNWLCDNCFEDSEGNTKLLFVKYYTTEKATITGGHKYGVVLVDTSPDTDAVINKKMIELNLARENGLDSKFLDEPLIMKPVKDENSSDEEEDWTKDNKIENTDGGKKDLIPFGADKVWNNSNEPQLRNVFPGKLIRSVPLVGDSDSDDSDKWDVQIDKDMLGMFGPPKTNITEIPEDKETKESPVQINKTDKFNLPQRGKDPQSNNHTSKQNNKNKSSITIAAKNNGTEILDLKPKSSLKVVESQSDTSSDSIDEGIESNNLTSKACVVETLNDDEIDDCVSKTDANSNVEKIDLDSDDLSSVTSPHKLDKGETPKITEVSSQTKINISEIPQRTIPEVDPPRKPRLVWKQNKTSVTLKIQLIGVEEYSIDIKERSVKFQAFHNDTNYQFDIELYGVVNREKSMHSNKGQYIQVNLNKLLQRTWLNLTKDCSDKKWIVYDIDSIDTSSDDETMVSDDALKVLKRNFEKQDSESEDDEFVDDANFSYKRNFDD